MLLVLTIITLIAPVLAAPLLYALVASWLGRAERSEVLARSSDASIERLAGRIERRSAAREPARRPVATHDAAAGRRVA